MRLFALTLLFITLCFNPAFTKRFDQCEFALELFEKHEVPRKDIYKHLCIVSTLQTLILRDILESTSWKSAPVNENHQKLSLKMLSSGAGKCLLCFGLKVSDDWRNQTTTKHHQWQH